MRPTVYQYLIEVAQEVAPALRENMQAIGPLPFPDRDKEGLSVFLSRAIVGQQLSAKTTRRIWARVTEAARDAESEVPSFFVQENIPAICACGVSKNKARALISVRDSEQLGILNENQLKNTNHELRSEKLKKIWGVGQWTCDMVSLFYCRDLDIWPKTDMAVRNAFRRYVDEETCEDALPFSPYRSYLALYMWRIVDGAL